MNGKMFKPNGGTKLLLIMVGSLLVAAGVGYLDFKNEKKRTDIRTKVAIQRVIKDIADSLRKQTTFLADNQLNLARALAKTYPIIIVPVDTVKIKEIIKGGSF